MNLSIHIWMIWMDGKKQDFQWLINETWSSGLQFSFDLTLFKLFNIFKHMNIDSKIFTRALSQSGFKIWMSAIFTLVSQFYILGITINILDAHTLLSTDSLKVYTLFKRFLPFLITSILTDSHPWFFCIKLMQILTTTIVWVFQAEVWNR